MEPKAFQTQLREQVCRPETPAYWRVCWRFWTAGAEGASTCSLNSTQCAPFPHQKAGRVPPPRLRPEQETEETSSARSDRSLPAAPTAGPAALRQSHRLLAQHLAAVALASSVTPRCPVSSGQTGTGMGSLGRMSVTYWLGLSSTAHHTRAGGGRASPRPPALPPSRAPGEDRPLSLRDALPPLSDAGKFQRLNGIYKHLPVSEEHSNVKRKQRGAHLFVGFLPGAGGDKAKRGPPRRRVPREAYHAAHEKTGLFFRPVCD